MWLLTFSNVITASDKFKLPFTYHLKSIMMSNLKFLLGVFLTVVCCNLYGQDDGFDRWKKRTNAEFEKWKSDSEKSWNLWKKEGQEAWERWKNGKGKKKKETPDEPNSLEVFWVSPKEDTLTLRRETCLVKACIFSKTAIKSIQVIHNSEPKGLDRGQTRIPACQGTPFQTKLKLKLGQNIIKFKLTNEEGTVVKTKVLNYVAAKSKRIALVIGNAAYNNSPLKNPINDANKMAEYLKKLGFEIVKQTDIADKNNFESVVQTFIDRSRGYDAAVVFYAGHGMQTNKQNYLIPTQANIKAEADIAAQAFGLSDLLEKSQAKTNIVLLDACRNNNFGTTARAGLADIQLNKNGNFFIGYATAPNETAQDGTGSNGVFTEAILKNIQNPVSIFKFYVDVTRAVKSETGNVQVPWQSASLSETFYFVE